ncbi:MAG: hypothetical protein LLF96_02915 [Eubacteriales bacterium]|nr:hypothetical protein [Eubacteriales bacterium]
MPTPKKPFPEVVKPVLIGSWHGRDAWKQGAKLMLNILFVSIIYLILSLLLTFDALALRMITALVLIATAVGYLYTTGVTAGHADAAFGEIMYLRDQEGKPITAEERERCFHPMKGLFAVLVGAAPYLVITIVFACITTLSTYSLGVLPSWLTRYTRQSGIGDALQYYQGRGGLELFTILRVVIRSMTMPFINVAVKLGDVATLWAERLSPVWILVAPMGYALGYAQGLKARTKINTGIAIGDQKKKRRERKARRERARKSAPERLI